VASSCDYTHYSVQLLLLLLLLRRLLHGASSTVSVRASRRRYTNRAGRGQFSSRSFAVRIGSFSELLQRTVRPTVLLPASQNSK